MHTSDMVNLNPKQRRPERPLTFRLSRPPETALWVFGGLIGKDQVHRNGQEREQE